MSLTRDRDLPSLGTCTCATLNRPNQGGLPSNYSTLAASCHYNDQVCYQKICIYIYTYIHIILGVQWLHYVSCIFRDRDPNAKPITPQNWSVSRGVSDGTTPNGWWNTTNDSTHVKPGRVLTPGWENLGLRISEFFINHYQCFGVPIEEQISYISVYIS